MREHNPLLSNDFTVTKKKNFYVTYYKSRKLNLSTAIYLYASQRNDIIKSKTKTFFSNVFENTKTNNINNLLVNYWSIFQCIKIYYIQI